VEPARRNAVVEFVGHWSQRTGLAVKRLLKWLDLPGGKYHAWRARQGQRNGHTGAQPRHFWRLEGEREALIAFAVAPPLEGYRRLTYRMLDADVVAVSPRSVSRVLKAAGLLGRQRAEPSAKGKGFEQPERPHAHGHIDVSYRNLAGTFYYLCAVLDGYSRFIVHWEIRERMQEADIEIILQRARERVGAVSPRIISDNGPQFIAKDFKAYIRLMGMTHGRTSPFYPQSNGKLERWHQSLKRECSRPQSPVSLAGARRLVDEYVHEYNEVRLHSGIGYMAPKDQLEGRAEAIEAPRREKLERAAAARRTAAQQARCHAAACVNTAHLRWEREAFPPGEPLPWHAGLSRRSPDARREAP
jgi:transposase InsO family protein